MKKALSAVVLLVAVGGCGLLGSLPNCVGCVAGAALITPTASAIGDLIASFIPTSL